MLGKLQYHKRQLPQTVSGIEYLTILSTESTNNKTGKKKAVLHALKFQDDRRARDNVIRSSKETYDQVGDDISGTDATKWGTR
jgi:hypothetical protein